MVLVYGFIVICVMCQGSASLLRIEPVRASRDDATYECVAENGVGDAVNAEATLTVYESKSSPYTLFK